MESSNQKESNESYFKPKRYRGNSNYLSKSASSNSYRQKPKHYKVKSVKKIYTLETIKSFQDSPSSMIQPTNKYISRKLMSSNNTQVTWRLVPKLIKSELDSMTKTLKSLLNKLTPTNFDSIQEKLSEVFTPEISTIFANLLLAKACLEVKYSETYSRLSKTLILKFPYFRNDLIAACQQIFESQALEAEDLSLNKKKVLGCVTFVGELIESRIISGKIAISCCNELLKKNNEAAAEGVCYFLSTCSSYFNSSKVKEIRHNIIKELETRAHQYSARLKFQVQDLIESRKIQAVVMRNCEKPGKINEIKN